MPAPLTFRAAIERTVQAAYDIARFTAEDPVAGLPDPRPTSPPLTATAIWTCSTPGALDQRRGRAHRACDCEAAAFATHKRITNSEGAGVSAQQSHFFSAHTRGFRGGYATSRHSLSVAPIASLPGAQRRNAARCLVQLAAQCHGAGIARCGGPLRRPARPEPPGQPQNRHHRMPGAV